MSWSYSGNPATSALDLVRFRLGDVEGDYPIASDEECLQALRDAGGNSYVAAAIIAESKATVFFMRPSREKRGDRWIEWQEQALAFQTLAKTLRMNANIQTTSVYGGGIDAAEREAERRDRSLNQPVFTTHLHDTTRHEPDPRDEW